MNSISLNIQFDQNGLVQLQKYNQQIIIVRSFAQTDTFVVASFAFPPFATDNIVEFFPVWQEYATVQKIAGFTVLKPAFPYTISAGYKIQFTPVGFQNQTPAYSPVVYGFENQNSAFPAITGGLTQQIYGNGNTVNAVMNVSAIPFNQTTYYQPLNSVKVFVASGISSNMVLPVSLLSDGSNNKGYAGTTVGKYLEVDISKNTNIYFDSINNIFVLGTLPCNQ